VKYKLDLVGVQEVKWGKGGTERAEYFTFFYGARNEDHQLGTGFFVHKKIISAVRRVEFVKVCLTSEDAFVITCVANLMEVKVLYVQQDLRYEISSYWRCNV
jgi:hypothetical protein